MRSDKGYEAASGGLTGVADYGTSQERTEGKRLQDSFNFGLHGQYIQDQSPPPYGSKTRRVVDSRSTLR